MSMKIIIPLVVLLVTANILLIGPALDKEYEGEQLKIIAHQLDNLDNQGDLKYEATYQTSDKVKIAKHTDNFIETNPR